MQPSALTPENSAIVMIDHAVRFGNVFRSHDLSLHVNNTVGLAKTASVFGIPLVLTNGADTGPYGPLFSELRAVTGGARVIVREANFINAFQTPEFDRTPRVRTSCRRCHRPLRLSRGGERGHHPGGGAREPCARR